MGAGTDLPLAVGLSGGGDHLFGSAGGSQALLVAAHTFACSGRFFLCSISHTGSQHRARGFQAGAAGCHRQSEFRHHRFQRPGRLAGIRQCAGCGVSARIYGLAQQALQAPEVAQRYPHRSAPMVWRGAGPTLLAGCRFYRSTTFWHPAGGSLWTLATGQIWALTIALWSLN